MNRKDRENMCALIARWTWIQGGSSSEASGRNLCIQDLRETFAITDEELTFSWCWELYKLYNAHVGAADSDDFIDALVDLTEAEGMRHVADLVDKLGFKGLRDHAMQGRQP